MAFEEWSDAEFEQFNNLDLPEDAHNDTFIQIAFDYTLFSPDQDYQTHVLMREFLINRLRDEYGIDFETAFDWDEYRSRGESNA